MFKIYDGRDYFYQWDLDRKLIVLDESIKEVHFCNKTEECSLVCEVYTEGELMLVNVPNILLQDNWRIYVYGYDGSFTKHSKQFTVKPRSKPADYIYTETEVKAWEDIKAKVEDNAEAIKELESKEVDLTGYATEEYVDNAVKNADGILPVVELETVITIGIDTFFNDIECAKLDLAFNTGLPPVIKCYVANEEGAKMKCSDIAEALQMGGEGVKFNVIHLRNTPAGGDLLIMKIINEHSGELVNNWAVGSTI